jgi:polysaccharide pyruvyl transferase WcaK-like protein
MNGHQKRITVCGSFGFGNAGDEAIPLSYGSLLKAAGIDYGIDVLSRFPKPDMADVIGTAEENRLASIKGQPVVVSGGGIIEEKERATVLRCKNFLSKHFSSNIAFLGVSVEPGVAYSYSTKKKILNVLNQSTLPSIYTRDVLSELTLRKLYPSLNIETVGDLVLWLEPSENKPVDFIAPSNKNYIAVSLSGCWSDEPEWYEWITNELITLCGECNAGLVFVPMSCRHDDDRIEHKAIATLIEQKTDNTIDIICLMEEYTADAIAAIYEDAILVVSMRLHGCVIAYSRKTPFVGISYHPKLVGFSYTVGLRNCIIPTHTPNKQSEATYGFRFKDLDIDKNLLVNASLRAIENNDFTSLDYFKMKSLSTLRLFLASVEFGI